jgi:putative Mg2+ transporter-C (MgtC) family protein
MRRDVVRGLTTAASIWLTAALGMACGAGLPILAVATTIGHFVIMLVFPKLVRRLPRPRRVATEIRISYDDGRELAHHPHQMYGASFCHWPHAGGP